MTGPPEATGVPETQDTPACSASPGPSDTPAPATSPEGLRKDSARPAAAADGEESPSAISLLKGIQGGDIDPRTISVESRRRLVEMLMADGASIDEMSEVLGVSPRTIIRDKQAVRDGQMIPLDPKLAEKLAGRLLAEADLATQRIRRHARDKRATPAVRVDAEQRCFQIFREAITTLQSMGFAPSAPQEVRAELTHHIDAKLDADTLTLQVAQLEEIERRYGGANGEITERLRTLKTAVAALSVQQAVEETMQGGDDHAELG